MVQRSDDHELGWLKSDGEVAARMRELDWTRSPLGAPATWPPALRAAVSLISESRFPMFLAWGPALGFLYNDAYAEILAAKHPAALGRPFKDIWAEIWPDISPLVERALAGHSTFSRDLELTMNRSGAEERAYFTFSYSPLRDAAGAVRGMFCAVAETTDRVVAERRLTDSEARLRALVNASSDAVYRMNADWSQLRAFKGDGSLSESPDPPQDWRDRYLLEEDRDEVERVIRHAVDTRSVFHHEHRTAAEDGGVGWTLSRAVPILGEDGAVIEWFGMASDITSRRDAAAAMEASEARFRLMADASPQMVWITDGQGRVEFFNRTWFDYTGTSDLPETADGVARDFVHPADHDRTLAAFEEATRSVSAFEVEHRIRRHDGVYRWFLVRAVPERVEGGEIGHWFGASVDIDDRRRAETALREREARLRFLDELGQAAGSETDPGEVLAVTTRLVAAHLKISNCAYADMDADEDGFTIRGDWAAPGSPSIVGHYSLADFGALAVKELKAGRPLVIRDNLAELAPHEARTFQDIGIAATICMPLIKGGRLTALMAIHDRRPRDWSDYELSLLQDVTIRSWAHVERARDADRLRQLNASLEVRIIEEATRRSEAQAALLQSQKMETIGQLTGGVAHDFNNLLTPIVGALDLARRRADGDRRLETLAEGGLRAAERARLLVQRLLAFSRRQHLEPRLVLVGDLLDGVSDLIARSLGPSIDLTVETEPDLWVRVDANQLELALLNLAVNARDAMPDGGALTLRALGHAADGAGDEVHIKAIDTGTGMDPETLARATEPFFTTKEVGRGTGLGLSAVHGLAVQSGGDLTLESRPGEGVTVTIRLPAAGERRAETRPGEAARPDVRLEGVNVLVVDDEPLVREAAADMLTAAGAAVTQVALASSALDLIHSGHTPDIVVTDHAMPGMTGQALARRLRQSFENLPILLVTGYARDLDPGLAVARLTKPFSSAELTAAVADALGKAGRSPWADVPDDMARV